MNTLKERADLVAEEAKKLNKGVYNDADSSKIITARREL